MIEQDLLIENRRGLDTIARRKYERNMQLSTDDGTAEDHMGSVVRGRLEQLLASIRHAKPVRTQAVPR